MASEQAERASVMKDSISENTLQSEAGGFSAQNTAGMVCFSGSYQSAIASPDGALSFLFGIFSLLMWYVAIHPSLQPATLLSLGVTWIILSIGAMAASLLNMIRGKHRGNMNLLATILLGFFPGVNTLITLTALLMGQPYRPVAYGIMYMAGSIFCFGVLWARKKQPAYIFVRTAAVAFGLFFLGLGDVLSNAVVMACGGWNMFVFSMLSFYFGLSEMYPGYGSRLPQGRTLFGNKKAADRPAGNSKSSAANRTLPAYIQKKNVVLHPLHTYESITSPSMIVAFICTTFGLMSFTSAMWAFDADSILAMGVIRIILGSIYFLAALINLFKGLPGGNLNLIFSVCFGLFAGSNMMIDVLDWYVGIPIQPEFYGIVQVFAALYLLMLIPAMKKVPFYQCCSYFCSALGLMLQGICVLCSMPFANVIAGWFFLGFALCSIYSGLSAVIETLPSGLSLQQVLSRIRTGH